MSSKTESPTGTLRCGVLGVGSLGSAIARRLAECDFEVCAYDLEQERVAATGRWGVAPASCPRELAERCEVVLVLLPDTPEILACLDGDDGLARGLRPGSAILLASTVDPETPVELAERMRGDGVLVLDTPVSGGPVAARAGELAIMVGAEPEAYARCLPVLDALGHSVHVGPVGHGEIAKLTNNLIGSAIAVAISEGLTLAAKAGADVERVREAIDLGSGASWLLSDWLPRTVLAGHTKAHFSVDLMCKDQTLIERYAERIGVPLRVGALVRRGFEEAREAGYGDRDFSVLVALRAREAGAPPLPLDDPL